MKVAAEDHESFADVGTPLRTETEAMEAVEPSQRALSDPAKSAQSLAGLPGTPGYADTVFLTPAAVTAGTVRAEIVRARPAPLRPRRTPGTSMRPSCRFAKRRRTRNCVSSEPTLTWCYARGSGRSRRPPLLAAVEVRLTTPQVSPARYAPTNRIDSKAVTKAQPRGSALGPRVLATG